MGGINFELGLDRLKKLVDRTVWISEFGALDARMRVDLQNESRSGHEDPHRYSTTIPALNNLTTRYKLKYTYTELCDPDLNEDHLDRDRSVSMTVIPDMPAVDAKLPQTVDIEHSPTKDDDAMKYVHDSLEGKIIHISPSSCADTVSPSPASDVQEQKQHVVPTIDTPEKVELFSFEPGSKCLSTTLSATENIHSDRSLATLDPDIQFVQGYIQNLTLCLRKIQRTLHSPGKIYAFQYGALVQALTECQKPSSLEKTVLAEAMIKQSLQELIIELDHIDEKVDTITDHIKELKIECDRITEEQLRKKQEGILKMLPHIQRRMDDVTDTLNNLDENIFFV
jgi:hypothetical protein